MGITVIPIQKYILAPVVQWKELDPSKVAISVRLRAGVPKNTKKESDNSENSKHR